MTINLIGRNIKGYDVHEQIGRGSFGAVYRAIQTSVGREVAIKVILPEFANDANFIRRFELEAHLVARLEHPHIIPLHDYWRDMDGAYLVMRYLESGNLRVLLSEYKTLPLETVVRMLTQIGEALTIAHSNKVIHRDIKPDNILVDAYQNAFLTDFGIAKHLSGNASLLESNDDFTGTPAYVSPEQIKSETPRAESDIYSLAFTVYEMIVGHSPFSKRPLAQIVFDHLQTLIPEDPLIPDDVFEVLRIATAKDPNERYQDSMSFAKAFANAVQAQSSLMFDTQPTIVTINPYKGLRAFEEADANDFFGRHELVAELLERFKDKGDNSNFLALVGPSGSGKSSVVKAGILPQLRNGALKGSEKWYIGEMTPDDKPFDDLASVLVSVSINPPPDLAEQLRSNVNGLTYVIKQLFSLDETLFLFIDQFEEVFTRIEDADTKLLFLQSLQHAIKNLQGRFYLVITIRADFYDRPLLFEGFADLIRNRTEVIVPLNASQLESAITGPATRVGLVINQDLLATIISDVQNEPGALPLLQYALTEVFELRDGNILSLDGYRQINGVTGALARRAEEIYQQLNEEERILAQQIFLRLVSLGEGTEDTRRRTAWSELISLTPQYQLLQSVLDTFNRYRLLSFDSDPQTREPTVEVAHEALIRQWVHLREWINESRQDIRNQRLLAAAAEDWQKNNRDASYLLSGSRLAQFEEWHRNMSITLSELELEFLFSSISDRARKEEEEKSRQEHEESLERRARRRMRIAVVVMAFATLISAGLTVLAFNRQQAAETAQMEAQQRANQLVSLNLADQAQQAYQNGSYETAVALAVEAADVEDNDLSIQRTLALVAYAPGTRLLFDNHQGAIFNVVVSPDGKQALSSSGRVFPTDPMVDSSVRYWNLQTGEEIWRYDDFEDTVYSVHFLPDGKRAVIGSLDKTLRLIDLETKEVISYYEGHTEGITSVDVNQDGSRFVSAGGNVFAAVFQFGFSSTDNSIRLWDTETSKQLEKFDGHTAVVLGVWFHPVDDNLIFSSSADGTVRIWDISTGEEIQQFEVGSWASAADISPDGHYLVAATGSPTDTILGSGSSDIIMWDISTGEEVGRFVGHTEAVLSVQFSPDGSQLISGGQDTTLRLWDVATRQEILRFNEHTAFVMYTRFINNGKQAISSSQDTTIRVWDLQRSELEAQQQTGFAINTAASMVGKQMSAVADVDGKMSIYSVLSGEILQSFEALEQPVTALTFNKDGTQLISGYNDGVIKIFDIASGTEISVLSGHQDAIRAFALSSDGKILASSSGGRIDIESLDNSIRLWDLATGQEIRIIDGHQSPVWSLEFSRDTKYLLSSSGESVKISADNSARIWNLETGEQVQIFVGHNLAINSAKFSVDGKQIITGSADNLIIIWDVETGQEIRRLSGHQDTVRMLVLTPDGKTIISVSDDGQLIQWDIDSGIVIRRLADYGEPMISLVLSEDGRRAMTASSDGMLSSWRIDLTMDDIIEWVEQNRYLRPLGCSEYLLGIHQSCETSEEGT